MGQNRDGHACVKGQKCLLGGVQGVRLCMYVYLFKIPCMCYLLEGRTEVHLNRRKAVGPSLSRLGLFPFIVESLRKLLKVWVTSWDIVVLYF